MRFRPAFPCLLLALWALLASCGADQGPTDHRAQQASRVRLVEHYLGNAPASQESARTVHVPVSNWPLGADQEAPAVHLSLPWPLALDASAAELELLDADGAPVDAGLDREGVQVSVLRHEWLLQAEAMQRSEGSTITHAHTLASLIALSPGQSLSHPVAAPAGAHATLVARAEAPEGTTVSAVLTHGDQQVATVAVGDTWTPYPFDLESTRRAAPDPFRVECRAEGQGAEQARLVVKRVHWAMGPFDQLWIQASADTLSDVHRALQERAVALRYPAAAPRTRQEITPDTAWDRTFKVPAPAGPVGTPVFLRAGPALLQAASGVEATLAPWSGAPLAWTRHEGGRYEVPVPEDGLYRLALTAPEGATARAILVQPRAAQEEWRLAHAVTGDLAGLADGALVRLDQDGDRRVALALHAPETVSFEVPETAPRTLRFSWASQGDGAGPEVRLVATWRDEEGREVGRQAVGIATGAVVPGWHPASLVRPSAARRLDLEAEGSWYQLGEDAVLHPTHLAVTPPVLVDPDQRPGGVVVYLVDTLRADHMQVYGYGRDTTPMLAELATEMAVFDHAYSNCSWTRPSTASLLTGLHPSFHGAYGQNVLATQVTTLAEHFHAQGYATGAIVANPNVSGPTLGFDEGFDEFHAAFLEGGGLFDIPASAFQPWIEGFLDRHGNEPFLLYVHAIDPHTPYTPPEEEWRRYDPEYDGPLNGNLDGEGHFEACTDPTAEDLEHIQALYDAEIRQADRAIGDLVEVLRGRGLWQDTGFLVTSDHGEEFQEHGGWTHGRRAYEEQLHVPLLIKPAQGWGVAPGRREHRAQLSDLAPTLYALEGLPDSPARTGEDLAGVLRGAEGQDPGRILYFDELPVLHALTFGEVKLIVYDKEDGTAERRLLFHLGDDPGEQNDQAAERLKRTDSLEGNLRQFYLPFEQAGLRRIQGAGRFAVIDEATVDRLMALGYL